MVGRQTTRWVSPLHTSLLQTSDYNMSNLPSQLFFSMNWLWCLCFVQEWMATACVHSLGWDIQSPSLAGEQMHNRGKILLTRCSVLLSETRHTGQSHLCTSLPLAVCESVARCHLLKVATVPLSVQAWEVPLPSRRIPRRSYPPPIQSQLPFVLFTSILHGSMLLLRIRGFLCRQGGWGELITHFLPWPRVACFF